MIGEIIQKLLPAFISESPYGIEIVGLTLLVLYAIVAVTGRRANTQLASKCASTWVSKGRIGKEFARLRPSEAGSGTVHMQESPSWYRMFFTGRRNCSYMHMR